MSKDMEIKGRCWVIRTPDGKRIDNIDTDMIFHNAHLHITEIGEMAKHAFGNLPGWEDFPSKCREGDIIIAGANFGCGSSRQQAVDCFIALGVSAIICESFGAIYKRNAINTGWPLIECPGILDTNVETGDVIRINLETTEVRNETKASDFLNVRPFSSVQKDLYIAGSLFDLGK